MKCHMYKHLNSEKQKSKSYLWEKTTNWKRPVRLTERSQEQIACGSSHFVFRSQFPTRCIFAILFMFTTCVMLSLIKLHSVYFASAFFVIFALFIFTANDYSMTEELYIRQFRTVGSLSSADRDFYWIDSHI